MSRGDTAVLLETTDVFKSFPLPNGGRKSILENIDMTIHEGEIVGILGRSGSGKSTLLRIINGLMAPTSGSVRFQGRAVEHVLGEAAMVFQTAALFPWLTVLENVRMGLEAQGFSAKEAEERSLAAIDLIGLDGQESAYPREISGGMRQRVGFARALVVNPRLLLMDEPFSALDVLTSQTLRNDLMDLWTQGRIPTKAILIVTHNIEEAVQLCDRVLIFGSNPGRIAREIPIALPRPRERHGVAFQEVADHIYGIMTSDPKYIEMVVTAEQGVFTLLPDAGASSIVGLCENLFEERNGVATLKDLAAGLGVALDKLLPAVDAIRLLDLALLKGDAVSLTDNGAKFGGAELEERKQLFARLLLERIPLAAHICKVLDERGGGKAPLKRFRMELEDHLTESDAEIVLRTMVRWGRFAELFEYSKETQLLSRGEA